MAATLSFSPFPLDHTGSTRMLKDFLQESNGNNNVKPKTASLIHAVVAAVKRISFPSLRSRRIFPRRHLGKRDGREIGGGDFVVKVRDIIRWRSFRDLIDESAAVDFAQSPDRYTCTAAGTATTTTTTTTTTSSNSSSWCESDFTAEDLPSPSWRGCSDDDDGDVGRKYFHCVGEETTARQSESDKKVNHASKNDDEEEQKTMDETSQELLEHVEETISLPGSHLDCLLVEFFRRELVNRQENDEANEKRINNNEKIKVTNVKKDENNYELLRKETYLREMEREEKWGAFGVEEKVELGLEIEGEVLGCLVDEILIDILQL